MIPASRRVVISTVVLRNVSFLFGQILTSLTISSFLSPFQVERLSEYEQYFASLLVDTHPDHPDRHHLASHHDRLTQVSTGVTAVKTEHLFPSFDVTSDRIDLLSLRCGDGEVITREIFPSTSVY